MPVSHKSEVPIAPLSASLRWLRVNQAAELFNVTEFWLRTQIRNGVLIPVQAGKRHLLDRLQVESLFEKLQREETERRTVAMPQRVDAEGSNGRFSNKEPVN